MRRDVLIALLAIFLLGVTTVNAINPSALPFEKLVDAINGVAASVDNIKIGGSAAEYEYVGISSVQRLGDEGIITFNNDCYAQFTGSRMCTSEEIMNTVNPPVISPAESAWVRPVIIGTAAVEVDISGFNSSRAISPGFGDSLSCFGWSREGAVGIGPWLGYSPVYLGGMSMDIGTGVFNLGNCSQPQYVTCCQLE